MRRQELHLARGQRMVQRQEAKAQEVAARKAAVHGLLRGLEQERVQAERVASRQLEAERARRQARTCASAHTAGQSSRASSRPVA